ncbi:hypothetical protein AJ78_08476 [Emergomyces pasteurianus Ep9510]|uniref:Uncharacterized protein n=1 Tax=Emergomyces pasteurianus Ep9510 TaxID=1447872 RepID=A0A1J9Q3N2_9EURO|nr:hypothetical protein AJ78_08476 [Emergomyces pasteurianus Ep9510]
MADEGNKKEEGIAVPAEATAAVPVVEVEQDEQSSATTVKQREDSNPDPAKSTATTAAIAAPKEDEEDSDLEDLDDVLDDFSAPKNPAATAKNPTSASNTAPQLPPFLSDQNATRAPESDLDENAFIQQLEQGMAELMGPAAGVDGEGEPDWDALAQRMAQGDMDPATIMKMLMGDGGPGALAGGVEGDLAGLGGDKKDGKGNEDVAKASAGAGAGAGASKVDAGFQETIRKTMERMQASGEKATAAATEDGGDDMLMQLLKAMESGAGAGGSGGGAEDENLDKIFMGIMEQLSNKEMLYEPMKELHIKFGPWLEENRTKVPKEDLERYELQSTIVAEIVGKFDEEGYSDDKPADRAFIWEKMQKMQAAGSPPDALVSNPLADELGLPDGLAGGGADGEMPQCPQQ